MSTEDTHISGCTNCLIAQSVSIQNISAGPGDTPTLHIHAEGNSTVNVSISGDVTINTNTPEHLSVQNKTNGETENCDGCTCKQGSLSNETQDNPHNMPATRQKISTNEARKYNGCSDMSSGNKTQQKHPPHDVPSSADKIPGKEIPSGKSAPQDHPAASEGKAKQSYMELLVENTLASFHYLSAFCWPIHTDDSSDDDSQQNNKSVSH